MANIICGECTGRHASVTEVRDCYDWAAAAERDAMEVCCFSCDGLIGYGGVWINADGARRGCGGWDICRRDFPDSF